MSEMVKNIFTIIAAGLVLLAGVFILRFVVRLAWKFVRTALIILSVMIIAGYFFGIFDISFQEIGIKGLLP
ncbi:MAG TPA: hypothetical protein DCL08_04715 [Anaerolineaceae bacterium]|nr:MAG: hypothetical protein XE06_1025 [Anaerolineaceae bacterium 46_22]HAF48531.1 hypothetical protein [Anaerolineaceae bacterium]